MCQVILVDRVSHLHKIKAKSWGQPKSNQCNHLIMNHICIKSKSRKCEGRRFSIMCACIVSQVRC